MRHRSRGSMVGESRLVRGFRSLSRMPWCYGAAEMAVDLLEWRGWKPYQVSAIRCAMHDFRHAYTETRPCIYTTAFVPELCGIGAVLSCPGCCCTAAFSSRMLSALRVDVVFG